MQTLDWFQISPICDLFALSDVVSEPVSFVVELLSSLTSGGHTKLTLLYSSVLYCTLQNSTGLYCTLQNSTALYWTLLDSTGLYWTLLDSTGLYWTLLDSTGLTWTHLDSPELTWTLLDSPGLYWTHLDSTGLYCTLLDSTGLTSMPSLPKTWLSWYSILCVVIVRSFVRALVSRRWNEWLRRTMVMDDGGFNDKQWQRRRSESLFHTCIVILR